MAEEKPDGMQRFYRRGLPQPPASASMFQFVADAVAYLLGWIGTTAVFLMAPYLAISNAELADWQMALWAGVGIPAVTAIKFLPRRRPKEVSDFDVYREALLRLGLPPGLAIAGPIQLGLAILSLATAILVTILTR